MDSIFLLADETRTRFLPAMGEAVGCTYICLWSYLPPPQNYLISLDSWYNGDQKDQPTSSTGSLPEILFNEYRRSLPSVEYGCVPGHAFKEGMPFLEIHNLELMRWVSSETQRQFYEEARIKTVIFMGCRSGEIEIGMANSTIMNMQLEISNFTRDFFQQYQLRDPNIMPQIELADMIKRAISPISQEHEATGGLDNILFPSASSVDAAITNALLAVLSSPNQRQETFTGQRQLSKATGAFVPYTPAIAPRLETRPASHGQYKMKLVFAMLRNNYLRMREVQLKENHPTSRRSHHIFSERMRRKKIKEEVQALRSLLPQDSKKDYASVLFNTLEYLSILKAQALELQKRNHLITMHLWPTKQGRGEIDNPDERVEVLDISGDESTSENRQIELRVTVSENEGNTIDLVLFHLLEYLEQMEKKMSLESMEAGTELHQMKKFNRAIFRLKIKRSEWDEQLFKEAMTRALNDVTRQQIPWFS